MTEAERKLWRSLRAGLPHLNWRKQVPIGPYFADFVTHRAKLVVEVDGGQHATSLSYDAKRTAFLNAKGFQVLRFWNNEVLENISGVVERIAAAAPPQ